MKKRKLQLCIEKSTISRLTNLNAIKGGETIGTLEGLTSDDCPTNSILPIGCPPVSRTCPPPSEVCY